MRRRRDRAWLLLAAAATLGAPIASPASPVDEATRWLIGQQRDNGAFGSETQSADQTAEAIGALVAGGAPDAAIDRALGYLAATGRARAEEQAAYAGRIVAGLVAAGEDPRAFEGTDYVALITGRYNGVLRGHGGNLYAEALSGLGRVLADDELPAAFLHRLHEARCPGGGFSYQDRCGRTPDADTTSMILIVLHLAGASDDAPAIAESLTWLRGLQHENGGIPLEAGFDPNANSTGLVVTMLATLGLDPSDALPRDPVAALRRFVTSEGGIAYQGSGKSNLYATIQALPGLRPIGYPLTAPIRTATQRPAGPRSKRTTTTGSTPPVPHPTLPLGSTRSPSPDLIPPHPSPSLSPLASGADAGRPWFPLAAVATFAAFGAIIVARRRRL